MMTLKKEFEIAQEIAGKLLKERGLDGVGSSVEEEVGGEGKECLADEGNGEGWLEEWLEESEGHRRLYGEMLEGEGNGERQLWWGEEWREEGWKGLLGRLGGEREGMEGEKRVLPEEGRRGRGGTGRSLGWRTWRVARVAAVVGLVAGGSVAVWLQRGGKEEVVERTPVAEVREVVQGESRAFLTLANGEVIDLERERGELAENRSAAVLDKEGRRLVYASDSAGREVQPAEGGGMNRVSIVAGGIYSLVLSDGSRVWLNSESELEYPVCFGGGERRVRLSGEAFFEVAADTGRPFVVETAGLCTRVLGTSFNLKAYPNEPVASATLFKGKVEVVPMADRGQGVVLEPGKQADWDRAAERLAVSDARLEHAIAWKEGVFMFEREDIGAVLRQIERWYGVQFVDETEGVDYTFNGYFSKDERLQVILETFTLAGGPRFEMKGDMIYVRNR